jgi:hypothetical protein
MPICLGNADQDIHQKVNKTVMGLGLGLPISCGFALDIFGESEKSRKKEQSSEQKEKDKKRDKTPYSLPATSGQQDEGNNEQATATAGLVAGIIVLALHEEGREKVTEIGTGDQEV